MSRITTLRTIRIDERPNLIWVEVETDEGLTGLGESFRGTQAVGPPFMSWWRHWCWDRTRAASRRSRAPC